MRLVLGFLLLLSVQVSGLLSTQVSAQVSAQPSAQLWPEQNAVILVYHHVDDSSPSITSVSPQQFEQHLEYLESAGFEVIALGRLLKAIEEGADLPAKSIAISFDDAYESVYSQAFPALKARNWPFSVFVASDAIDRGCGGYMSWEQLAEVLDYGAEIGGHSASHAHLVRWQVGETQAQWLWRVTDEIDRGNNRIEEVLHTEIELFAYPYGEFNEPLQDLLRARNIFGLAQHSGAVGALTDLYAVPRYPMAASYANMDRFTLVANTKALPVVSIEAGELLRTQGEESGYLQLSLADGDYQLANLACYSAAGAPLAITTTITQAGSELSVALPDFSPGRAKINCTAPSASERGVFYWFSHQWIVKTASGDWPAE